MQSKPPQLSSRLALIVLGLYPMAALAQTAATPALVFTGIQTSIPVSGLASVSGVARDPSGNLFVLDAAGQQVIEIPANWGPAESNRQGACDAVRDRGR